MVYIFFFERYGIDAPTYSAFLAGAFWNQDILQINYDDVSTNFNEHIISYGMTTNQWDDIVLYNATSNNERNTENMTKPGFKEFSIFGVRCFTIDIPFEKDLKLMRFWINLKNSIFSSGTRPAFGGNPILDPMFIVAPHYPKQFYAQVNLGQKKWPVRKRDASPSYIMEFNLRNVEIYERRDKYDEKCEEGIPDNDGMIDDWILEKVGCKPPYWSAISDLPLCSTFPELQLAGRLIQIAIWGDLKSVNYTETLPCRSLEKIQYDVSDIDDLYSNASNLQIVLNLREYTYKEVKSVRSMDMQGFVGSLFYLQFLNFL